MIARVFLLLALMLGLALGSGPIPGGHRVVNACTCCPLPDGSPCCSTDEGPISDAPLAAPTVPALKSALVPALPLLGTLPVFSPDWPTHSPRLIAAPSAHARLARLCTRLI